MSYLKELMEQTEKDFEAAIDPEQIKSLASTKEKLQKIELEQQEFLKAHNQLKDDYVLAVKNSVYKDKESNETPTERSPRQILKDLGLEKEVRL